MLDTKVGTDKKDDPADVAKNGFKAMMSGEGRVVSGWQNKLEAAAAHVIPSERLARKHSEMAAPGRLRSSAGRRSIPTGTPGAPPALERYGATSQKVDYQFFRDSKHARITRSACASIAKRPDRADQGHATRPR